ncbi:MAG: insulinase family protein [Bacteroidia bacterium]|nr:insulinase family protein [Bacteroidia bacterium]
MKHSTELFTLANGIRCVFIPVPVTQVVQCGIVWNAGSRDEQPTELGLAHFLEHLAFKGTNKRKAWHILNRLDVVGGELNAYTSKEKIVFEAAVIKPHFARAMELLCDLAFHSIYPPPEIEKERSIIADEISMYADNPEESIFEEFDSLLFGNHSLGHPIAGTINSINQFQQTHFQNFTKRNLRADRICLVVTGNLSLAKVEKIFSQAESEVFSGEPVCRIKPTFSYPTTKTITRKIQQGHLVIGGKAVSLRSQDSIPFLMLNYWLGGYSMNSKLNLNIREKHGIAYNLYTFHTPYTDCGIWGVYAASDPQHINKLKHLIYQELAKVCTEPLTKRQLSTLKRQFKGNLLLHSESGYARMLANAKDLLDFGEIYTINQILQEIDNVTEDQLFYVANQYFQPNFLSEICYLPE